jgi:hypothetical protein
MGGTDSGAANRPGATASTASTERTAMNTRDTYSEGNLIRKARGASRGRQRCMDSTVTFRKDCGIC